MATVPADSSTGSVNLPTNSTINNYGAWVEVIASTTTAISLLAITGAKIPTGDSNAPNDIEFDIGTGAAASEVVLIEALSSNNTDAGSATSGGTHGTYIIPMSVPIGTRIAARVKGTEGPGGVFNCPIQIIAFE